MNRCKKILLSIFIVVFSMFSMGMKKFNANPQNVYRVYLGGKSIGLVKSKKSLEKYIDR